MSRKLKTWSMSGTVHKHNKCPMNLIWLMLYKNVSTKNVPPDCVPSYFLIEADPDLPNKFCSSHLNTNSYPIAGQFYTGKDWMAQKRIKDSESSEIYTANSKALFAT